MSVWSSRARFFCEGNVGRSTSSFVELQLAASGLWHAADGSQSEGWVKASNWALEANAAKPAAKPSTAFHMRSHQKSAGCTYSTDYCKPDRPHDFVAIVLR
jgi:hypothetical protein